MSVHLQILFGNRIKFGRLAGCCRNNYLDKGSVAIGNPERHVRKDSHRGNNQQ